MFDLGEKLDEGFRVFRVLFGCDFIEKIFEPALGQARFETFADFKAACEEFFSNPSQYQGQLRSLLTENFAIVGE